MIRKLMSTVSTKTVSSVQWLILTLIVRGYKEIMIFFSLLIKNITKNI